MSFVDKYGKKPGGQTVQGGTPVGGDDKGKSFSDLVNKSRGGDICLVLATDKTMRKAWYFVMPTQGKREKLLGLGSEDSCNLEDFGKIVLSGYGDKPPQWAYDKIKEDYGTEF